MYLPHHTCQSSPCQSDCLLVPPSLGLVCYSNTELVFFYSLASLPDVQLMFGGTVALSQW